MTEMKVAKSYHVHNADLVQCEPWGKCNQTLLRFKGVSCGHGYRSHEATIVMDKAALKKMVGTLKFGESTSNVEPLPEDPPCRHCEYWEPQYVLGNILCCTKYRRMRPSFSCYQPRCGEALATPMPELTWTSTYKFEGGEWDPVGLLKDLKGAVPIEEPPCRFCKHWNPGRKQWGETIECCTVLDNDMFGDFSCYRARDGAK